jgi:hypothetical protein
VWLARKRPVASAMAEPRYHAVPAVAAGQCNDATYLLNKGTGRYYRLDEVGGELWTLLRRSHELSVVYETPPQDIVGDVSALIDTLMTYGVIDVDSTSRRS